MDRIFAPDVLPITLVGVVMLVLLAITVVIVLARGRSGDAMQSRLTEFAGVGKTTDNRNPRQAIEQLDKVMAGSKRGGNIQRDLARADLKLTVAEFILIKVGCAVIGVILGVVIGRASPAAMFASALVGGVLFSFLPNVYMSFAAKRRVKMFNDQLGDTITMMANALRGGYSFLQTLDMVGREAPNPISAEFRRVVQEVGLGRTTEEALGNLLRRMPSEDLDLLITAVNIQMEVGGNLAQILDTIGHTIRERVRIKGEINTLTAQGRISAWVITGLPIGLAIIISVINPSYMSPIFSFGMPPEHWCCLPVASLVMIVAGYFAIMRIMDIEV